MHYENLFLFLKMACKNEFKGFQSWVLKMEITGFLNEQYLINFTINLIAHNTVVQVFFGVMYASLLLSTVGRIIFA